MLAYLGGRLHLALDTEQSDTVREGDMKPLFEAILKHVPVRDDNPDGPLQMQVTSLDYSSYVGKIGIGRINDVALYRDLLAVGFIDILLAFPAISLWLPSMMD